MEKRRTEETPGGFPAAPVSEGVRGRAIRPGTPPEEPLEAVGTLGRGSEPLVDRHGS